MVLTEIYGGMKYDKSFWQDFKLFTSFATDKLTLMAFEEPTRAIFQVTLIN